MSSISRKGNNRRPSGTVDRRLASEKTKVHHAADASPELLVKNGLYQGEAETGACKGANQSPMRNALHHPLKNTKLCFEDRLASLWTPAGLTVSRRRLFPSSRGVRELIT